MCIYSLYNLYIPPPSLHTFLVTSKFVSLLFVLLSLSFSPLQVLSERNRRFLFFFSFRPSAINSIAATPSFISAAFITFFCNRAPSSASSSPSSLLSLLLRFTKRMASSSPSSPNWTMENGVIPHVLAVDDSLIDRKLIERLLRNSSCKVTTAENGPRALEFLGLAGDEENTMKSTASKVNLVITDYCMPGMTGYELLKKIKESSIMKEVPVVIMSSENIPTRINKCLEEGAQMFIQKPLKQSDVKKLTCQLMNCRG